MAAPSQCVYPARFDVELVAKVFAAPLLDYNFLFTFHGTATLGLELPSRNLGSFLVKIDPNTFIPICSFLGSFNVETSS